MVRPKARDVPHLALFLGVGVDSPEGVFRPVACRRQAGLQLPRQRLKPRLVGADREDGCDVAEEGRVPGVLAEAEG